MAKGKPTILTDIEVETVGLVESGAVNETFFLVKSDEGGTTSMSDKEHPETEQVEVSESLLEKLKGLFATKDEVQEAVAKAAEPEKEKEGTSPDPMARIEAIEKAYAEKVSELAKANSDLKTAVEATAAELAKAQETANTEREKRIEREFIEKAATFVALPTDRVELGKKLHALSKAVDQETYDWLFALLKAADQQAFSAGIFNELGSTASSEEKELVDKVEKAVKEGVDPKEALMKLSLEEQQELLSQMPYERKVK